MKLPGAVVRDASSSCDQRVSSMLHTKWRDQQYFPWVIILLHHEAASQSQCLMPIPPSQSDGGAGVKESFHHQTGGPFSFLPQQRSPEQQRLISPALSHKFSPASWFASNRWEGGVGGGALGEQPHMQA